MTFNEEGEVEAPDAILLKFNEDGTGSRYEGGAEVKFVWQIQRHEYIAFTFNEEETKTHPYIINEEGELIIYSLDSKDEYGGFKRAETEK